MKTIGKLCRANDEKEWICSSAYYIAESIKRNLKNQQKFNIAVSGGNTPGKVFIELVENEYLSDHEWTQVSFYWVDERVVPKESAESNFGNAYKILKSLPSDFHPMYDPEKGLDKSVKGYNGLLKNFPQTNGFPVFDLIVLGIGNDGHTASLFPHTKALEDKQNWVIINDVHQLNTKRITLTFPVIKNARDLLILMNGNEKLHILKEIISGNTHYPIEEVLYSSNNKTWLYY